MKSCTPPQYCSSQGKASGMDVGYKLECKERAHIQPHTHKHKERQTHKKIENTESKHFESETYMTMKVKPVQHSHTEATRSKQQHGHNTLVLHKLTLQAHNTLVLHKLTLQAHNTLVLHKLTLQAHTHTHTIKECSLKIVANCDDIIILNLLSSFSR